jgi:hypothetical protein
VSHTALKHTTRHHTTRHHTPPHATTPHATTRHTTPADGHGDSTSAARTRTTPPTCVVCVCGHALEPVHEHLLQPRQRGPQALAPRSNAHLLLLRGGRRARRRQGACKPGGIVARAHTRQRVCGAAARTPRRRATTPARGRRTRGHEMHCLRLLRRQQWAPTANTRVGAHAHPPTRRAHTHTPHHPALHTHPLHTQRSAPPWPAPSAQLRQRSRSMSWGGAGSPSSPAQRARGAPAP